MELIKGKAPGIWHIVYIHQYIYAAISIAIMVGLGIPFIILCSKYIKGNEGERESMFSAMLIIGGFFTISVLTFLIEALPRLINPAYYTIRYFLPGK